MPETRGFITEEDLQMYGGANIMLLDNISNQTSSGSQTASGSGNYNWSITWNDTGFTGENWYVPTWDDFWHIFEQLGPSGDDLKKWFEEEGNLGVSLGVSQQLTGNGNYYGCVTFSRQN